ncbi:MAG: FAD binding domain-containing protein [Cetobacterium sp.]|uniref:FAD binding domain-containing protein n=1 Tax=Cetobacterium sp. TaxID=2071632 RepID=UPI003F3A789D
MINYYTPKNLEELYSSLKNMTSKSKIIGGGTDLGICLNKKIINPDILLYIGNIKESKEINLINNFLEIGSSVTHTEIENSELILKYFKCLAEASENVGSLQIRNNGTIGGNIGNASPAGDLIPVLYMLDALVTIVTSKKEIIDISIKDFILGPGKIKLNSNEVILKFKIPLKKDYRSSFMKLGSRKKLTISRIGLSIGLVLENNIIKNGDIVVGAISLKPISLNKAFNYLIDKNLTKDLEYIKEVVFKNLSETILEITPEKFDKNYKAYATKGIVDDIFNKISKL